MAKESEPAAIQDGFAIAMRREKQIPPLRSLSRRHRWDCRALCGFCELLFLPTLAGVGGDPDLGSGSCDCAVLGIGELQIHNVASEDGI